MCRIRLAAARTDGSCVITVADSGPGLPPGDLTRVFERFYRVDKSRSRPGTGLGLAISKNMVGLMGGKIGVASQAGEGSTFWFTLSLEKQAVVTLAPPDRGGLQGLRVLVLDPARGARQALVEMLLRWECEPIEADSVESALRSLRREAAAGTPVGVGAHTIAVTATDAAGNSASCTTSLHLDRPWWGGMRVPGASVEKNASGAWPAQSGNSMEFSAAMVFGRFDAFGSTRLPPLSVRLGKIQPKKWCSVPKGQIQPQKTRPNTSVTATIASDHARPR